MTPLMNLLACLLALLPAPFLWTSPRSIARQGAMLSLILLSFVLFVYLAGNPNDATMEFYPLEMLAFCLCVSTLTLSKRKIFFMSLAQGLWLWIVFFGSLSLFYRGLDISYLSMLLLAVGILSFKFLKADSREFSFAILTYWVGIWMLF